MSLSQGVAMICAPIVLWFWATVAFFAQAIVLYRIELSIIGVFLEKKYWQILLTAAYILPLLLCAFLATEALCRGLVPNLSDPAKPLIFLANIVLSVWLIAHTVRFTTRASVRRRRPISVPRIQLSEDAFKRYRILIARAFTGVALVLNARNSSFVGMIAAWLSIFRAPAGGPSNLATIGTLLALLASTAYLTLLSRIVSPRITLIMAINGVLGRDAQDSPKVRWPAGKWLDPFSWGRREVRYIEIALDRLARRYDTWNGSSAGNPASAIYRAIADSLRVYLSSRDTILADPSIGRARLKPNVAEVLRATELTLIGSDPPSREYLIHELNIFDEGDAPRPPRPFQDR